MQSDQLRQALQVHQRESESQVIQREQIANLLETTLKEEKAADEKLTYMAMSSVNLKAAQLQ